MSDLVLLPVVLLHLVLQQFHPSPDEGFIIARIVLEPALAHMNDVSAYAVQEVLRVRYQHEDTFVAGIKTYQY